ncbi:MAG: TMEM175 family protein [Thermovirgaceae bacterium]|nr:TMEM175 family protein [Thermovirgaceae bacterium]
MVFSGKEDRLFSTGRIEALSDGVFAIVMTILVLDLRAPSNPDRLGHDLFRSFISGLGEPLFNFFISFLLLSLFWIWQHRQFKEIRRTDPVHITINLTFLAVVSLIPFSTSLMSRFIDLWEADMVFHFNILAAGLLLLLNWHYATRKKRLVDSDIDPEAVAREMRRSLTAPLMALFGIFTSLFITGDSSVVYMLIPFMSTIGGACDSDAPE